MAASQFEWGHDNGINRQIDINSGWDDDLILPFDIEDQPIK